MKAISIRSDFAKAYLTLSTLHESYTNNQWQKSFFSDQVLQNLSDVHKVDIFFARAKVLEGNQNFSESSKNFINANYLNRKIYSSIYEATKAEIKKFILLSQDIETPHFIDDKSLVHN